MTEEPKLKFHQPLFITERTYIDLLDLNDCEFIMNLVNSRDWLTYIGDRNIRTESDARFYVQRILDNPDITYWVVRLNDSKIPIGIITFMERDYLDFHDIGFAFLPEYHANGYAFESTSVVLKTLLTSPHHPFVLATTVPGNTKSIKLLLKLKFSFEKEINVNNETLQVFRITSAG